MAGCVEIKTRFVDFAVDGEGWAVDRCLRSPRQDMAFFIDEDEVGDFDLGEVGA